MAEPSSLPNFQKDLAPFKLNIQSAALKGLYVGIIQIICFVLLYVAGMKYLSNPIYSAVVMLLPLVPFVLFGINERNTNYGGYLTYMQAFLVLGVMSMVSILVYLTFHYIMYGIIDPELSQKMIDGIMDFSTSMIPEEQRTEEFEQAMEKTRNDITEQFSISPMSILIMFGKSLAGSAVFNFLLALFVKRKKELF
jgi:hypothetical protein